MRYNEKLPVPCIYLLRLDRISDWPDIHAYLISFIWLSVVYNYKEDQVTITRKMLTCIFCSTLFYNWKKAGYLFPTNFQLFLLPCCVLNSGQLLYPPTSTGENSHLGQLREFFKINFIQAKSVFIFFITYLHQILYRYQHIGTHLWIWIQIESVFSNGSGSKFRLRNWIHTKKIRK